MVTMNETMRAFRERHQISQKAAAAMCGVSQQYYNDIEHGRREFTDSRLKSIADKRLREALIGVRIIHYQSTINELMAAK